MPIVKQITVSAVVAFVIAWSYDYFIAAKPDPMLLEARSYQGTDKATVHDKIDYLLKGKPDDPITPERIREVLHDIVEAK